MNFKSLLITTSCVIICCQNLVFAQSSDNPNSIKTPETLLQPPYLNTGDTIAIVAPSGVLNNRTKEINESKRRTKRKIKIIGVGGVDSGQSAYEKITAGADAVQLYTGMVYKGPGIVKEIKKDLISILKKEKIKNISEAVGINA